MHYGGVDQKSVMAGDNVAGSGGSGPRAAVGCNPRRRRRRARQRGAKGPNGVGTVRSQPPPMGRRRSRFARTARAVARQVLRREGPRAAVGQRSTIALGQVKTNTSGGVEVELTVPINPLLMRESSGPNTVGPIQMLASSYALWKLRWVKVFLKPLVGGSAVSGTIVRASLNQSGEPGQNNWSGLGARRHVDVTPGKHGTFTLEARDIPGMRQGWFDTNPNGGMGKAIGGTLEIHTYGATVSTYQAKPFTGPLFLVEVMCHWDFANFQSQPGLLQMEVGTQTSEQSEKEKATVDAKAGGPIDILVDEKSKLGIATGNEPAALSRAGGEQTGNTVWMIVDSAVSASTSIFPPPFSWLAQAGWWFVKRIFGAPVSSGGNTLVRLRVYQNFEDAQNNRPCIATSNASSTPVPTEWTYYQLTGESTGLAPAAVTPVVADVVIPEQPKPVSGGVRVLGMPVTYENVNAQNYCSPEWYVYENTATIQNGALGTFVGSRFVHVNGIQYVKDPLIVQHQTNADVIVPFNQIKTVANLWFQQNGTKIPVANVKAHSMVAFGPSGQTDAWVLRLYCVMEQAINYVWGATGKVWKSVITIQADPATTQGDSTSNGLIPKPMLTVREMAWGDRKPSHQIAAGAHVIVTFIGVNKISSDNLPFDVPEGPPLWARPTSATVTPIVKFPEHSGFTWSPDFFHMEIVVEAQSQMLPTFYEDDEGDEESTDEEDCAGDWDVPPPDVLLCFSEEGARMERRLRKFIIGDQERALAVQAAKPSRVYELFKASYQSYLVDGCSPPTARSAAVRDARELIEAKTRMTDGSGARSQLSSWSDFN
nr:capsid protein [Rodent astrovirus]APA19839.1 capsid protein [Rodent astrovirus]APA19842.1 capsid protein [Rodent astrovirus]